MKRLMIMIGLVALGTGHYSCTQRPATAQVPQAIAAAAQEEATPAPAPQAKVNLPAGHPEMSSMPQPDAMPKAQMPEGMSLPPGHPPIPGRQAADMPGLPSGHPDISEMRRQQTEAPAEQVVPVSAASPMPAVQTAAPPEAADACCPGHAEPHADTVMASISGQDAPAGVGVLEVHVSQGTPEGPAINTGQVILELHQQKGMVGRYEADIDSRGVAIFEDLPVHAVVQPVIKMFHGEVEYQHSGRSMGPAAPSQRVDLVVYESTEETPLWQVRMRHLMVQPVAADWLQVSEIIAFENPLDRAWLGRPLGDGRRASFELKLPANAHEVQVLSGFHACCARLEDGRLFSTAALLPGQSQYQIAYLLPVKDGKAVLPIDSPAATRQLALFLPDDGSEVTVDGLQAMGSTDIGEGARARFFRAGSVPAGQQMTVQLAGLVAPVQPLAASAASADSAKVVAGVGALLIVLVGAAFLFLRSSKPVVAAKS